MGFPKALVLCLSPLVKDQCNALGPVYLNGAAFHSTEPGGLLDIAHSTVGQHRPGTPYLLKRSPQVPWPNTGTASDIGSCGCCGGLDHSWL